MKRITDDVQWGIGCDFHPSFQRIAILDTKTGEVVTRKLTNGDGDARRFYESLRGQKTVVGIEACGNCWWFEQMLGEMGHQLWIGDAARIRAMEVRKQKTDERDALHILDLMCSGRFPDIWVPTPAQRDTRQLILHRHRLVQMRTRVKNQLQHLALNHGVQKKYKLWSKAGRQVLEQLPLQGWTARRREDLLPLLDDLEEKIAELSQAVEQEANANAQVQLLCSHPGVGPITALAYVLTMGDVSRFEHSKNVASYLGLIPTEDSSSDRRRLGHISKQGNSLLRGLLVEAGQSAARFDPDLKRAYQRLKHKKQYSGIAKVMVARKLAIRLYWILRNNQAYTPARMQGSPGNPVGRGQ
jgi:transposase